MDIKEEDDELWPPFYYIIGSLILIIPLIFYVHNFRGDFSNDPSDWGTFGDYLAGIAGTLFSFMSFILLIRTLYVQTHDSKNKDSNDIFFKLIDLLSKTISEMKYKNFSGEEAFKNLAADLDPYLQNVNLNDLPSLKTHYTSYITIRHNFLGHYFRLFYNILKFIDECPIRLERKHKLVSFLKAVPSQDQLILLFYNCLAGKGEDKFKPLIEKYHFFNNLELITVLDKNLKQFYNPKAFNV